MVHNPHYSKNHVDRILYTTEDSSSNPKISPRTHHKIRHVEEVLKGELRNIKPPTFYGENMKGEDVEAVLSWMRKYLRLHSYSSNMEGIITIYNLQ